MPTQSPDVVVIGAGIIGGSIAWRLAQSGMRVTMVDAGAMGGEASWAGAGMLAPGGEMETRDVWSDLGTQSLAMYPAFVDELQGLSGTSIDFQQCGAAEIVFSAEEWPVVGRRAAAQRTMGIPSAPLAISELRGLVAGLAGEPAGVLFYPQDALVDPRDVTRALKIVCGAVGVAIREGWPVRSIQAQGANVAIGDGQETITAGAAVVAAGAWSGEIAVAGERMPTSLPPTMPVRGHLIGYNLAAGSIPLIVRSGHTYLLQRRNGFTIAGTSSETVGFERPVDSGICEEIARRAAGLLPILANAGPYTAWNGFRPATPNLLPEIRRVAGTRLWLAYGHYRNGILLAPITSQMISQEIISNSETVRTLPSARR
jgi:glycine oxidase